MLKKKLLVIIAVIIVALGGFYFFRKRQQQKLEKEVSFEQPKRETLTKKLQVSGFVDAKEKVNLRFLAGGKLVQLNVKAGDKVKKNESLAVIDQRDLQKRLDKTLNNYMTERWNWEEYLDDTEDRHVWDDSEHREKDQKQWRLEQTIIDVEIMDIAISDTVLRSPFDGIVVKTPTNVAAVQLSPSDYFQVVNPQTLIFKAFVDEEDMHLIKEDQVGVIHLDAFPDHQITSSIDFIGYQSVTDNGGTSFLVELPVSGDSELKKYKLGLNGDVELLIEEKQDVLTIPLLATRIRENATYVNVLGPDNQVIEKEVKIGLETDEKVEVLQGLTEKDRVIIPD